MQSSDVISFNIWQMSASLANLILLFLMVKNFLYKPVKKILEQRQSAILKDYCDASEAKEKALSAQNEYEEKLQGAKSEADTVIRNAVNIANEREKEILAKAKRKADGILLQAENDAILEHKKAEDGIKKEIFEVSSILAEKMLEREISANDHKHFIDSFIESIGD